MTERGPIAPDEKVANRALGYTKTQKGELRSNASELPARASSAGDAYSTAVDFLRFAGAKGGLGIAGGTGGTGGANAVLESPGPTAVTAVVLPNLDPLSAERVSARLRKWMPSPANIC